MSGRLKLDRLEEAGGVRLNAEARQHLLDAVKLLNIGTEVTEELKEGESLSCSLRRFSDRLVQLAEETHYLPQALGITFRYEIFWRNIREDLAAGKRKPGRNPDPDPGKTAFVYVVDRIYHDAGGRGPTYRETYDEQRDRYCGGYVGACLGFFEELLRQVDLPPFSSRGALAQAILKSRRRIRQFIETDIPRRMRKNAKTQLGLN